MVLYNLFKINEAIYITLEENFQYSLLNVSKYLCSMIKKLIYNYSTIILASNNSFSKSPFII